MGLFKHGATLLSHQYHSTLGRFIGNNILFKTPKSPPFFKEKKYTVSNGNLGKIMKILFSSKLVFESELIWPIMAGGYVEEKGKQWMGRRGAIIKKGPSPHKWLNGLNEP